jgi:hypothetical protein
MKTRTKALLTAVLITEAFGAGGSAFAALNADTVLDLENSVIFGNCVLSVTVLEPYSAFNSNCNLDKNDITIWPIPLPGYYIGYPRSTVWTKTWPFLRPVPPEANARYCARFGIWTGGIYYPEDPLHVEWGHYSNPALNKVTEGDEMCETAVPQVKAYYQTQCLGTYVWVFSIESLVPGLHLSYRNVSSPLACWAVAIYPGPN